MKLARANYKLHHFVCRYNPFPSRKCTSLVVQQLSKVPLIFHRSCVSLSFVQLATKPHLFIFIFVLRTIQGRPNQSIARIGLNVTLTEQIKLDNFYIYFRVIWHRTLFLLLSLTIALSLYLFLSLSLSLSLRLTLSLTHSHLPTYLIYLPIYLSIHLPYLPTYLLTNQNGKIPPNVVTLVPCFKTGKWGGWKAVRPDVRIISSPKLPKSCLNSLHL